MVPLSGPLTGRRVLLSGRSFGSRPGSGSLVRAAPQVQGPLRAAGGRVRWVALVRPPGLGLVQAAVQGRDPGPLADEAALPAAAAQVGAALPVALLPDHQPVVAAPGALGLPGPGGAVRAHGRENRGVSVCLTGGSEVTNFIINNDPSVGKWASGHDWSTGPGDRKNEPIRRELTELL